jgi:hypothetical protein
LQRCCRHWGALGKITRRLIDGCASTYSAQPRSFLHAASNYRQKM